MPQFTSIAETAGLRFRRYDDIRGLHRIIEANGGGVVLFDYDADGRLDVFFTNGCRLPLATQSGSRSNRLFRNRGRERFGDATAASGTFRSGYWHGCTVGDYDGDGFPDLYVTAFGPDALWHNNGDGTFRNVTAGTGTRVDAWGSSAAFADVNRDGHLDLYVVNYLQTGDEPPTLCPREHSPDGYIQCPPHMFEASDDVLFLSDGAGGFRDATRDCGITGRDGKGLGVVVFDADRNGLPDICVANDGVPNFLYMNRTVADASTGNLPRFREEGARMGVSLNFHGDAEASMGIAAGDYNGDGWIDLLMTHFEGETNTLYQNLQGQGFADRTPPAGLATASLTALGFGTEFLDVDNDGRLDLFVANGHVDDRRWKGKPYRMPPQMFRNEGDGTFRDVSRWSGGYFRSKWLGRGAAAGDVDNDGDLDLAVSHQRDASALLRNDTQTTRRSVIVKLVGGSDSNRSAVGARVEADAGDFRMVREIFGGGSFQSASDPRIHLGLRDIPGLAELRITWPSGHSRSRTGIEPGHYVAVERQGFYKLPRTVR